MNIKKTEEKNSSYKAVFYALLTAIAASLYVLESFIPKPLPFMRLGLANIVVLILLINKKTLPAFIVAIAKTVLGAFFIGMLFSPGTILGLSGSAVSIVVMFLLIKSKLKLSAIGISALGSVFHGLTQIFVVRQILIQNDSVFYVIPLIILISTISGFITGFIANEVNFYIKQEAYENIFKMV